MQAFGDCIPGVVSNCQEIGDNLPLVQNSSLEQWDCTIDSEFIAIDGLKLYHE